MKVVIAVLLAIVLALAWRLYIERAINSQLQSQLAELSSKLTDKAALENFELRQKCALQGGNLFRQLGYKLNDLALLQTHYNAKLNKCFLAFDYTTSGAEGLENVKYLLDAIEQREYAEYIWKSEKDRPFLAVPPLSCKLIPSSVDTRICKSEEEYRAFVAHYME
jgi:hypothetical protein